MENANFQIQELEQRLEFCSCPSGQRYLGQFTNQFGTERVICEHKYTSWGVKVTEKKYYNC